MSQDRVREISMSCFAIVYLTRQSAHERIWKTEADKALFTTPAQLSSLRFEDRPGRFRLITSRSNDQFNTTIYGYADRFRGTEGTREALLMNPDDTEAAGFQEGQMMRLIADVDAGVNRSRGGLKPTPFDIPSGTVASYDPECNVLVPISHHDVASKAPGSKSIPVRIEPDHAATGSAP